MSKLNYDDIAITITEILNLIEQYPDKFQHILLEVLLTDALRATRSDISLEPKWSGFSSSKEFMLPIDVRAFFIQFNLDESLLDKLFYFENNQVSPIWKIKTTKKSIAQIHVALLIALENALQSGSFEFAYEDVRNRCKKLLLYDGPNFSSNFKYSKRYFKSLLDKERIALSPVGKEELSNAILELTSVE